LGVPAFHRTEAITRRRAFGFMRRSFHRAMPYAIDYKAFSLNARQAACLR